MTTIQSPSGRAEEDDVWQTHPSFERNSFFKQRADHDRSMPFDSSMSILAVSLIFFLFENYFQSINKISNMNPIKRMTSQRPHFSTHTPKILSACWFEFPTWRVLFFRFSVEFTAIRPFFRFFGNFPIESFPSFKIPRLIKVTAIFPQPCYPMIRVNLAK